MDEKERNNSHNSSNTPIEKANRSSSSVGDGGVTPSKDESANEDIAFRRQHFDRNSILRTSKKRGRKSSVTSTSAGNSTPVKNTGPNSNTSVNEQNKTPKSVTPKNDVSQQQWINKSLQLNNTSRIINNSALNTTKSSEENKTRVYVETKINSTDKDENSLHTENAKNLESKTSLSTVISDQKHISNKQDEYNDINEKTYRVSNNYRDKQGETKSYLDKAESTESSKNIRNSSIKHESSLKNHLSSNIMYGQNNAGYEYKTDEKNKEVKLSTFTSASDNVAALLGKDNSTKTFVSNNLTKPIFNQQKQFDANISKSRNAIKSNGIKENTATSGASVIRTRREAMRQAEEEAGKSSGRTTRRQHSNNGDDNNRGITTSSKKNEKQDRITQEEDCGRLI